MPGPVCRFCLRLLPGSIQNPGPPGKMSNRQIANPGDVEHYPNFRAFINSSRTAPSAVDPRPSHHSQRSGVRGWKGRWMSWGLCYQVSANHHMCVIASSSPCASSASFRIRPLSANARLILFCNFLSYEWSRRIVSQIVLSHELRT